MKETNGHITTPNLSVRTYARGDSGAVLRLFEIGRLAGQVMANDTAADLDNIEETYLNEENANFWVAECDDRVIGMIGVTSDDPHAAEVRRLRVDPDFRGRGVALTLMETALAFCRHHGHLKVTFDTQLGDDRDTRDIFDRFAFQHNRTRNVGGKDIQEFYLDLYREIKGKDEEN